MTDFEFKNRCLQAAKLGSDNAEKVLQPGLAFAWALIENSSEVVGNAADIVLYGKDDDEVTLLFKIANCLSDTLSTLVSTTQGFSHPPSVVLRSVVESLSCVVCFRKDKKAFASYKSGAYHLPKAVSAAQKTFPGMGRLYGALSNFFTHEQIEGSARAIVTKGRSTALLLIPPLDEDFHKPQLFVLSVIIPIAYDIAEITEWCFAKQLSSFRHWRRIDKDNLIRIDSPQKTLMKEAIKDIIEKLGPPQM